MASMHTQYYTVIGTVPHWYEGGNFPVCVPTRVNPDLTLQSISSYIQIQLFYTVVHLFIVVIVYSRHPLHVAIFDPSTNVLL